MPTTLHSIDLNEKLIAAEKREGAGVVFAVACGALLLIAVASIFALPAEYAGDLTDQDNVAWLIGP